MERTAAGFFWRKCNASWLAYRSAGGVFGLPGEVTGVMGLESKPLLLWRRALGSDNSFECHSSCELEAAVAEAGCIRNSESSFGSVFHSSSVSIKEMGNGNVSMVDSCFTYMSLKNAWPG